MQKIVDTLKQYLPVTTAISQAVLAGYFSADFFVEPQEGGQEPHAESLPEGGVASSRTRITDVVGTDHVPGLAFKLRDAVRPARQSNGTAVDIVVPYGATRTST